MDIKQYCKALKLGGEGNEDSGKALLRRRNCTGCGRQGGFRRGGSPFFPTRDSRPGRPSESKYLTVFISGYTEY